MRRRLRRPELLLWGRCDMRKLLVLLTMLVASPLWSFNLWQDIQTQTNWDLGKAAAGGTAIALAKNDALNVKAGDPVPSALAEISDYRFLSAWYGGNQFTFADGTSHWKDTAKIGLNAVYIFRGFVNQPPAIFQNLVIGPSLTFQVFSSPRVFVPFLDLNYQFGGSAQKTQ